MPFSDPATLFTERGISRPELDKLDAAHKVLCDMGEYIAERLRELGMSAPDRTLEVVEIAIADLTSEPVNAKSYWVTK